ncbi:MAG: hypothetical protein FJX44_06505 [Alphaproteobacteria bacterium]|nr:hypothetical protein [Alphaproteobacteria bacterium]
MAKKRIFTVGFDLPGDEFEYVEFDSDQTLLDADIILFQPTLGNFRLAPFAEYGGKSILDEHSSFASKRYLDHWRSEIVAAVGSGKLVVVYLVKPFELNRYTGEKRFSGTGRNRATTMMVTDVSSYEAIPSITKVTSKSGSEVRLEKEGSYLAHYWSEFAGPYEAEIEGEFNRVILRSRAGNRVVAAAFHAKSGGSLLLLPPLHYDEKVFLHDAAEDEANKENEENEDEGQYWTEEAFKFGKRLVAVLVALSDTLKQSVQTTPPPAWSLDSKYRLSAETDMELVISERASAIIKLQNEKADLENQLVELGNLRSLLYEQGRPLENAVIEAMTLFGFKAEPFSDGESEFDCVFVSTEGRCLGEVEGKDNKAINIEKFSQLERNLQEDFERDEVTEHAKGVLFGNAYRLQPVDEREDFFTAKCISAAKRIEAALVRTPDLFGPAKYLKENSSDSDYAAACRNAIFHAKGEVVVFPSPPISDATSISVVADAAEGDSSKISLDEEGPAH